MNVQKFDPESLAIDPARISQVIAVSRVWLGIGDERRGRHLGAPGPDEVQQARRRSDVSVKGASAHPAAPCSLRLTLAHRF